MLRSRLVRAVAVGLLAGCGPRTAKVDIGAESGPIASTEFREAVDIKYAEIKSQYFPLLSRDDQDLLRKLDRIEAQLSGAATGDPERFLPKLAADEEMAHFRESFRRWEEQTGRRVRAEVDAFKADLSATKDPTAIASMNHKLREKYKSLMLDLIAIERMELIERRGLAAGRRLRPVLDQFRDRFPDEVQRFDDIISRPPFVKDETGSDRDAEGPKGRIVLRNPASI